MPPGLESMTQQFRPKFTIAGYCSHQVSIERQIRFFMVNLSGQSFIPTNLGRVEEERIPPGPGISQSLVYADKPQTLDRLEDNIRRVIAAIRPQMLEKAIENWMSRLDYIRASCGSPMPEIIFKM
ncbi:hypothetical protein TNCV_534221 [Trichonephila clavipes]|nr:hypothetical protein TNCV_534221 [Trichonephila clavipes]